MQLTPEQQQIVEHTSGHAKITAVAGAGKTTTLALFIRERLVQGENPKRMLVIMYNKAAKTEFDLKLKSVVGARSLPQVRTFHSLGLRIYQRLIQDGILPPFQDNLLGQAEMEGVLWQTMQKIAPPTLAKDILEQKKKWVEPMVAFMDRVKAELDPPALILERMDLPKQCDFFPEVFVQFEQWRHRQGRISYNDMLYDPCQLFSKRPDVALTFANHMNWILVDEYQDINPVQQFLLQTLAGERSQVMVIGDPDQTIYEFRGSRPEFMQTIFDQEFQPATGYTLSKTFRYGHHVSLLANQLIQHNPNRDAVLCLSDIENNGTEVYAHIQDDYGLMTRTLIQQCLQHFDQQEIAVLNRLWGISAPIELALLEADIPYKLDHPGSVLDRMELQPFMFLLEIATGSFTQKNIRKRQYAWQTFFTLPYLKVKRALLDQVAAVMSQAEGHYQKFFEQQAWDDLTVWQRQQIEARIELVGLAEGNRIKAHQLFNRHIRETDFYKGLSDSAFSKQQVDDRIATVQAFVRFCASLNLSLPQLHEHLEVLRERKQQQDSTQYGVLITSIHKAKGLEWPVVIIPGMTEHYFPYQPEGEMSVAASEDSERRLLYVAMTRAKQQLHLIMPPEQGSAQQLSPFISELQLEDSRATINAARGTEAANLKVNRRGISVFQRYAEEMSWSVTFLAKTIVKPSIGTTKDVQKSQPNLRHAKFGEGVLSKEDNRYYHIVFNDGQKRVLDKHIAGAAIEWLPMY